MRDPETIKLSNKIIKGAIKALEANNQDPFYPIYNSQHTINAIEAYWKRTDPEYIPTDEREALARIRLLPTAVEILENMDMTSEYKKYFKNRGRNP